MTASSQPPTCRELFLSFLKLGAVSFGGPAIVAYMRRLVVERRGWLDSSVFDQGAALCQVVPGAISVQMAFYVGMRLRGVRGGLVCCTGYVCAPFVLVLLLSALYCSVHQVAGSATVLKNMHALVIAILAHAACLFGGAYLRGRPQVAIACASAALFAIGLHPAAVVCCAGIAGYVWCPGLQDAVQKGNGRESGPTGTLTPLVCVGAGALLFFLVLFFYNRALFRLTLLMSKIDLFAFGGGYTSVPLMLHEIVTVHRLLDMETLLDGIAIGQMTPGPVVLTATFIGYLLHGMVGAVAATVSVFLPSCAIIISCMPYYDRLSGHTGLRRTAEGILCSFVGLIAWSAMVCGGQMEWTFASGLRSIVLFCALLGGIPVPVVVTAGVILAAVW